MLSYNRRIAAVNICWFRLNSLPLIRFVLFFLASSASARIRFNSIFYDRVSLSVLCVDVATHDIIYDMHIDFASNFIFIIATIFRVTNTHNIMENIHRIHMTSYFPGQFLVFVVQDRYFRHVTQQFDHLIMTHLSHPFRAHTHTRSFDGLFPLFAFVLLALTPTPLSTDVK